MQAWRALLGFERKATLNSRQKSGEGDRREQNQGALALDWLELGERDQQAQIRNLKDS
jgi:hypothetical protein